MYINNANAETVFLFLTILGAVGVVVAWLVTRGSSHKHRHP